MHSLEWKSKWKEVSNNFRDASELCCNFLTCSSSKRVCLCDGFLFNRLFGLWGLSQQMNIKMHKCWISLQVIFYILVSNLSVCSLQSGVRVEDSAWSCRTRTSPRRSKETGRGWTCCSTIRYKHTCTLGPLQGMWNQHHKHAQLIHCALELIRIFTIYSLQRHCWAAKTFSFLCHSHCHNVEELSQQPIPPS